MKTVIEKGVRASYNPTTNTSEPNATPTTGGTKFS